MRPGEIAVVRWRNCDPSMEPLGKLTIAAALNTRKSEVKGTKTGAVRRVPVHSTLAALLAEWKLSGWAAIAEGDELETATFGINDEGLSRMLLECTDMFSRTIGASSQCLLSCEYATSPDFVTASET